MTTDQHYLWYLASAQEWGSIYSRVYYGDGETGLAGEAYSTGTDYLRHMHMKTYGDGKGVGDGYGNGYGSSSGFYDY